MSTPAKARCFRLSEFAAWVLSDDATTLDEARARARDALAASKGNSGSSDPAVIIAEVHVATSVWKAAQIRARRQAQVASAVCVQVLMAAARSADVAAGPPSAPRRIEAVRHRVRFRMDRESYVGCRERLARVGISITEATEDGLRHYAQEGTFTDATPRKAGSTR
jgi:hypothetical protein